MATQLTPMNSPLLAVVRTSLPAAISGPDVRSRFGTANDADAAQPGLEALSQGGRRADCREMDLMRVSPILFR